LALLLEVLGITHLGGSPVAAIQPLAPDMQALVRPTVQRGLLARGLLLPMADGSLAIDGALQRLLRLCAYPDAALLITSRSGDSELRQQEAYYRLGELAVRHFMPLDGVHELMLLAEMPDVAAAIVAWLGERTAAAIGPALRLALPIEVLERAQAEANPGATEATRAQMEEVGAAPEAAGWLASALAMPTARLQAVVLAPNQDGTAPLLALLCDAQRCWSVQEQEGPSPMVVLETIDLVAVASLLQRLIASWEASVPSP
jgi:hypothetical protein